MLPPESAQALDAWLAALVGTPGLTAIADLAVAREMLLADSLRALPLVAPLEGPLVDVGSGGGAPGIPLAYALPRQDVVLVEAERRKCAFLEQWAPPNARVVWGRVEEQLTDWAGVAVAKALAHPPTAAEWCLPLLRVGGVAVIWVGRTVDLEHVERVAGRLAADLESSQDGLVVLRKTGPTPAGFPRRVGVARKRPLA